MAWESVGEKGGDCPAITRRSPFWETASPTPGCGVSRGEVRRIPKNDPLYRLKKRFWASFGPARFQQVFNKFRKVIDRDNNPLSTGATVWQVGKDWQASESCNDGAKTAVFLEGNQGRARRGMAAKQRSITAETLPGLFVPVVLFIPGAFWLPFPFHHHFPDSPSDPVGERCPKIRDNSRNRRFPNDVSPKRHCPKTAVLCLCLP